MFSFLDHLAFCLWCDYEQPFSGEKTWNTRWIQPASPFHCEWKREKETRLKGGIHDCASWWPGLQRDCCARRLGCARPHHSSQVPRSTYKKGPVATPMSSSLLWGREEQSVCPHWYKRSGSLHPSRSQERRTERAVRNKILSRMEYPLGFCQVQQETPVQSQPCLVWRDFFESPSRRLLASWILPHRKAFFKVDVCGGS